MGRRQGGKNRPTIDREQTISEKQKEEDRVRPYLEHPELDIDVKKLEAAMDTDLPTPTVDSPMVKDWEAVGDFDEMTRDIMTKYSEITGNAVSGL
jgi:hypothetical protein